MSALLYCKLYLHYMTATPQYIRPAIHIFKAYMPGFTMGFAPPAKHVWHRVHSRSTVDYMPGIENTVGLTCMPGIVHI